MHQNQWLAAIEDLKSEGFEDTVVPGIAHEYGKNEFAYKFFSHSEGEESAQGRWAKGPSMDGKGEFEYVANPKPIGPKAEPPQPNPQLHGTPKTPQAQSQANGKPNMIDRAAEVINRVTPGDQSGNKK